MNKNKFILIIIFVVVCGLVYFGNRAISDDRKTDVAKEVEKTQIPISSVAEEKPEVEEPKVEEPKVEEPKVEEPKVEEPKVEEPEVAEPIIAEEEMIAKKVIELQAMFPRNSYWNHNPNESYSVYATTQTPCVHDTSAGWKCECCNQYVGVSNKMYKERVSGIQCLGFASLCSDYVFGKDAPIRRHEDFDQVKVGDQARINNNSHSVFIIEKTDNYIIVGECNADYLTCVIGWGRKIYRSQLGKSTWYITRYH